ncbi:MAG TPA: ABC transporter substrate-binding protein [Symbiobacteriaceae bacterium]|nr:ABC transporter substrate-binding protein [Symbiobacteriaceae bacterium]
MKRRLFAALVAILTLALALSGCGSGNKPTEQTQPTEATKPAPAALKTLTIPILVDPGTGDGQMTTEEYLMPLNLFDRLVEVETTGPGQSKLVAGLAERWEASADGKAYTFFLRKGVKFHNGEELTADDVVYTFDRMLNPKTKALNTDFLDMIAGAKERMEGKADSTSGLKVIDKYTVEITLASPFAPFLAGLATPGVGIYNKKATEAAGDKFGQNPVGTGPFKLKSWEYNSEIVFEAFPDYFRGKAGIDQLIAKVIPSADTQRMEFEAGNLDVFDLDNARTQIPYFRDSAKWKNQIVSGPRVGTYYYALNQAVPPLDNLKIRQAIQYGINRELLLEKFYYKTGIPAKGVLSPGLAGYNASLPGFPYDKARAQALVKESGVANPTIDIWQVTDSPSTLQINEAVQAMLGEIGIKVNIKQVDSATWMATRKASNQMAMYHTSWSADFNDPDNFLYTFFAPNNSKARSFNEENARVVEILEKCRQITDMEERYKLYQEAEKLVVYDDAAWVPLFHLEHLFVVSPKVKNFKVSWNGWSNMPYYGIKID